MRTVQDFEKQIKWLEDFIERWDKNESAIAEAHRINACKEEHELLGTKQCSMIDEYSAYCKDNNLADMSADELLSELKDQQGCTADGKF